MEVIEAMKKLSYDFETILTSRRVGDPDELVSDITLLKNKLNWTPKYNNLELICKTALDWEMKL